MILRAEFYQRPALRVARELLGKFLVVRKKSGKIVVRMITEVEAYDGARDKASHASNGKTERNKVMFEDGGIWYVYFIYGMHHMLNVVVGKKNYPAAILIRGVKDADGPGKLTRVLGIGRHFNGLPASRSTGLWIENRGMYPPRSSVKTSPRIGVAYAGPVWSKKHYRFFLNSHDIMHV